MWRLVSFLRRSEEDPRGVADINLRNHFGLQDGDVVEIRIPT